MRQYRILKSPEAGAEGTTPGTETATVSLSEPDAHRHRAEPSRPSGAGPKAGVEEVEARFAKEIAERERQSSEWERAFKSALRDREIATALAGKPLVSGAAAQLITLWRDEFSVHEERGEFRVLARDGRPITQAVAEMLDSAEFSHFRQPSSRGGTAQRGAGLGRGTPAVAPSPRNLGEAVIMQWRESMSRPDDGSAPIGLRRRR